MASTILTGRTGTWTGSGTITSDIPPISPPSPPTAPLFSAAYGQNFGAKTDGSGAVGGWAITLAGNNLGQLFVTAIRIGGLGVSAGTNTPTAYTSGDGTFDWSCDYEEGSTFASVNGRQATWVIQQRPKIGGTLSFAISFNGQSYSGSKTITALDAIYLASQGGHIVQTSLGLDPAQIYPVGSDVAICQIASTWLGYAIQRPFTHTYNSGNITVDLTGGVAATVEASTLGVGIIYTQQPTKQGQIIGQINAFDIPYPASLITEWAPPSVASPAWTPFNFGDTISLDNSSGTVQSFRSGGFTAPNFGTIPTIAQGDGLMCRINPASLTVNGEQITGPEGGALNARLKPFNMLTMWQDASYVVDPCTSAVNWTSNVTLVGGFLQVNSALNGGVATKSHPTGKPIVYSEGYRYIEFDIQPNSTGGGALTLELNNQFSQGPLIFWEYAQVMGSAGVLTTIRFDLLAPFAVTGGSVLDAFASRVLDSKYIPTGNSSNGPGWGIDQIWSLKLLFPPSTGTFQIHAIRLVRDTVPRVTFLQSDQTEIDNPEPNPNPIDSSQFQRYKYALADTDGKRSLEIGDLRVSPPIPTQVSAGIETFSSITNLIAGWHVTPNASLADLSSWYGTPPLYLSMLGGAGCIYTGLPPSDLFIDWPLPNNPTQIQYQGLATSVIFPPNCGDLTNMGATSGPFKYYTYTFLRQRTTGVAIGATTQLPISGATVTESGIPSGAYGSGVTNAKGRFLTGNDYAKTIPGAKSVLSGVDSTSGTISFQPRTRDILRLGYVGRTIVGGPAWHLQDEFGQLHQAVIVSGDVWYRRSDFTVPNQWQFFNQASFFGDVTYAASGFDPSSGVLYMLIERHTGGVYNTFVANSTDRGQSWTTPTLYMATARPLNPFTTQMGGFGYAWFVYDSGSAGNGTVWATVRNAGDTSWPTPWQIKDNQTPPQPIHVTDGGWGNIQMALNEYQGLSWCPILVGQTSASYLFSTDQTKTFLPF